MAKRTEILVARFYKQIAYVTVVTAIVWTFIAVFNTLSVEYPSDVRPEILEQLNPTIDTEIIQALKGRTDTHSLVESYVPTATATAQTSSGL